MSFRVWVIYKIAWKYVLDYTCAMSKVNVTSPDIYLLYCDFRFPVDFKPLKLIKMCDILIGVFLKIIKLY